MLPRTHAGRILFLPLTFLLLTHALAQNITVDDAATTGVVPQYLPAPSFTQGATCTGCGAQPDASRAFGGTWHDATFTPGDGIAKAIELDFNGSAIYIFFILANTIQFVDTVTNMNFIIDESLVGSFVHEPSTSTDFQYNVPVYVNESLSNGQHHIRMEAAGNHSALILFDYLVYTSNTANTTASLSTTPVPTVSSPLETQNATKKSNSAPIIGGAVGGVVAVAILACLLICCWRRKNQKHGPDRITAQEVHGDALSLSDSERATTWSTPLTLSQPRTLVSLDRTTSTDRQRRYLDSPAFPQTVTLPTRSASSSQSMSTRSNERIRSREARTPLNAKLLEATRHPDTVTTPNSRSPITNNSSGTGATVLQAQVERLMDEVACLRQLHLRDRDGLDTEVGTETEAPPGYSEGRASLDSTV
ncbi:uncharacterized protein FOMMEDRAFT_148590 [Fomitiporia mediterranea MF3/22]|uniref:uncharacterized protein n=1 Tax=Fomitiporia mediterranea (strain MF3/22) TaxID=694068 RepID=UPI0004409644|nr:uncharacterized protein FOMMEDRAFT_148590 [Fomitiporia mediterranea MF3/22]EJC99736.1 hypothetical protein FOMMEDRAFT_148590 [Fomitiporia mediterranea MF3/22]